MEKISGDFNKGYTKAILDLTEICDSVQYQLKLQHKNLTYKTLKKLLVCAMENRKYLRESIDNINGFIRWNKQKDDFE